MVSSHDASLHVCDQYISWKKAIDRVLIRCSQVAEIEPQAKKQLSSWASMNGITFVDVELLAGYITQKESLLAKHRKCNECPHYDGPTRSEILTLSEINDPRMKWLLRDYFCCTEDVFDWTNYHGKYIFYFSSKLLKESANENCKDHQQFQDIPERFWRVTRVYGSPAFAFCDRDLFETTKYWYGVNPLGCIPEINLLFC